MNPCFRPEPPPHCCHGRCAGHCKPKRKRRWVKTAVVVGGAVVLAALTAISLFITYAVWVYLHTP